MNANVASQARLGEREQAPRGVISPTRFAPIAAATVDPAAAAALRIAAVTGARRSELAALRWDDLADGLLTIEAPSPRPVSGPALTSARVLRVLADLQPKTASPFSKLG